MNCLNSYYNEILNISKETYENFSRCASLINLPQLPDFIGLKEDAFKEYLSLIAKDVLQRKIEVLLKVVIKDSPLSFDEFAAVTFNILGKDLAKTIIRRETILEVFGAKATILWDKL